MFPLLGVFFLDYLLELVHFLALLRKRLLCGIGFLSAFLSSVEIGFFHSIFLKPKAITSIVRCECASMLLAKVAQFLGTSFLWDSGTIVSTRLLRTLLLAVRSFLVARIVGFLRSFLATYVLDCLKRQKEQTLVHRSTTFLVKVVLILPAVLVDNRPLASPVCDGCLLQNRHLIEYSEVNDCPRRLFKVLSFVDSCKEEGTAQGG